MKIQGILLNSFYSYWDTPRLKDLTLVDPLIFSFEFMPGAKAINSMGNINVIGALKVLQKHVD